MASWRGVAQRYRDWNYRRLTRGCQRLSYDVVELREQGFFSQCGQDKYLFENLLSGQRGGVFVDIGAHDGIAFSNTNFFETTLGWSGLAVEPLPDVFARLVNNRSCVCVNCCVSSRNGYESFRRIRGYSEMLSGLSHRYDPRHLARIDAEVRQHGGEIDEIDVPSSRLADLLSANRIARVDYLNIDVEGAELEILKSIDFSAVDIRICGIENNYGDYRIPKLMRANGYRLDAIVGDEIYVKESNFRE